MRLVVVVDHCWQLVVVEHCWQLVVVEHVGSWSLLSIVGSWMLLDVRLPPPMPPGQPVRCTAQHQRFFSALALLQSSFGLQSNLSSVHVVVCVHVRKTASKGNTLLQYCTMRSSPPPFSDNYTFGSLVQLASVLPRPPH